MNDENHCTSSLKFPIDEVRSTAKIIRRQEITRETFVGAIVAKHFIQVSIAINSSFILFSYRPRRCDSLQINSARRGRKEVQKLMKAGADLGMVKSFGKKFCILTSTKKGETEMTEGWKKWSARIVTITFAGSLCITSLGVPALAASSNKAPETTTPIEHLIVVIGENHTFDNIFGGYKPKEGETIDNLLSKGIIDQNGNPGPNFDLATQQTAKDVNVYNLEPKATGPYAVLPQPETTYANGLPQFVPDVRFPANLPNGPFQITKFVNFDDFTGDPVHRFFQMWQQTDNGRADLFVWVGVQTGIGPQNNPPRTPIPGNTFQGGEAMGFYNMSTGDAPVFKSLADNYAISDNYHQAVMGGTGANFFAVITGDVAFYNINGKPKPSLASQVEDPNPLAGTNNF